MAQRKWAKIPDCFLTCLEASTFGPRLPRERKLWTDPNEEQKCISADRDQGLVKRCQKCWFCYYTDDVIFLTSLHMKRERERERSLWTMNAETPECHFMSLLDSPSKLSQLFQVNSQWQAGARCFLSVHLRILLSATVWWSQGGNNIYSPYIPRPESSLQKGLRKFLALLLRTITPDCVALHVFFPT